MAKCTEGKYEGEICLKPPASYPVTENGKLSPGRIRNAAARAAQNQDTATIKRGGLCRYLARIGAVSDVCPKETAKNASTDTYNAMAKSANYYGVAL